jgi:outer membrane protein TolC
MIEREMGAERLELANEVRASVRRVRLAEETLSIFTTALLQQLGDSLHIAEVSYREGEISLLDFLDSQRTYNALLGDYHQALFEWNAARAALEKALGEPTR